MKLLPAPVAILDFETTGLFPGRNDRVVEVGVVVVGTNGQIEREFETLINPGRDIGPSRIHGINSEDVLPAPSFEEIASQLFSTLDGCIAVAGHNVRFDHQFLMSELKQCGHGDLDCPYLCTMSLAGGRETLEASCSLWGVTFDGKPHQALNDARANAKLLVSILNDSPRIGRSLTGLKPISWPAFPKSGKSTFKRSNSQILRADPPSYLQRLIDLTRAHPEALALDGAELAYADLLDKALEDRQISRAEEEALLELACKWGLSAEQVRHVNREYLGQLVAMAVADGVVTEIELRDLTMVARLLGIGTDELNSILDRAKKMPQASTAKPASIGTEVMAGKRVCFTGELNCSIRGEPISRELAESLAEAAGLTVADSVTKKLDILVVADPHSQSGKAKKARQYGIRIMHEQVFWNAIGAKVT